MKKLTSLSIHILIIIALIISGSQNSLFVKSKTITVFTSENSSQVKFALYELEKSLKHKDYQVVFQPLVKYSSGNTASQIILVKANDEPAIELFKKQKIEPDRNLKPEGFCIRHSGKTIWLIGNDDAGLMYGGFELAEIIETSGLDALKDQTQNPYMKMRGVKFNIPLDVRTPTYTDPCDAAQKNMAEMWNFDFWKEYIDSLAHFRYNLISLWNLHPFPSMVKVPEYPDVALNDVRRSRVAWKETYSLNGQKFDAPEIVDNYEVLIKMTIDEKIAFWCKVMSYAKERNVRFYILTWNIFDYGVGGKYGITDKVDNPITRDYFRKSVKEMLLTYPDLAGIGLTTGENMYGLLTEVKEDWAFDTYGQGVLDVAKMQPERNITFIHRQHQTGALEIAKHFQPLVDQKNVNFIFSYKYAQAHVYSSINQPVKSFVDDIQKDKNLKTIWTLRNDDVFYFRWGAPDYVRDFIKNIPYDVSEGYYYGSDQYVWGREFLSKYPDGDRQIEISKHWYHFMMWGRLGYNPEMSDDRFISILQNRFPQSNAKQLFAAWQNASMIYPLVTGFHWGSLDFQWYIESGQSQPDPAQTPSGYHDVNRFISLKPHVGTGDLSIPDYVEQLKSGKPMNGITPLEVASSILAHADSALNLVSEISHQGNQELCNTVNDIQSMAYLGKYYAHKIIAATHLELFRKNFNPEHQTKTLEELQLSALYWRYYASTSLAISKNPLWTNRVGVVDWKKTYKYVLYDITANGGVLNIPSMESTSGGTILEAENASFSTTQAGNKISGYSGTGYLETKEIDAVPSITWTYQAPEAGNYSLEFRYTSKRQQNYDSTLKINGKDAGSVEFWSTGNAGSWVWDRVQVTLKKGENTIEINPEGAILLDHVNVLKN